MNRKSVILLFIWLIISFYISGIAATNLNSEPSEFQISDVSTSNFNLSCSVSENWKRNSNIDIDDKIAVAGETVDCTISPKLENNATVRINLVNNDEIINKKELDYRPDKRELNFNFLLNQSGSSWFLIEAVTPLEGNDIKENQNQTKKTGAETYVENSSNSNECFKENRSENISCKFRVNVQQKVKVNTDFEGEISRRKIFGPEQSGFFYTHSSAASYYQKLNKYKENKQKLRLTLLVGLISIFGVFEFAKGGEKKNMKAADKISENIFNLRSSRHISTIFLSGIIGAGILLSVIAIKLGISQNVWTAQIFYSATTLVLALFTAINVINNSRLVEENIKDRRRSSKKYHTKVLKRKIKAWKDSLPPTGSARLDTRMSINSSREPNIFPQTLQEDPLGQDLKNHLDDEIFQFVDDMEELMRNFRKLKREVIEEEENKELLEQCFESIDKKPEFDYEEFGEWLVYSLVIFIEDGPDKSYFSQVRTSHKSNQEYYLQLVDPSHEEHQVATAESEFSNGELEDLKERLPEVLNEAEKGKQGEKVRTLIEMREDFSEKKKQLITQLDKHLDLEIISGDCPFLSQES